MTLSPDTVHLWHKEYPMFWLWAKDKDILFLPKAVSEEDESKQYDLTSKMYILMKRLKQNYETILTMPVEERDLLFDMEMKLIEEEHKQSKGNNQFEG
jgi:hypothetical protein